MADADIHFDAAAVHDLFASESGPLAKDLQRRGLQVDRQAKTLCPVDTGRLRASITNQLGSDAEGLYVDVGTNVEYAIYVEIGTQHMAAQPYLRPALEAGSR